MMNEDRQYLQYRINSTILMNGVPMNGNQV